MIHPGMWIKLLPLLFLAAFGSFSEKGLAGNIVISGMAPDYHDDSLIFIYSIDPFSGYLETAGKVKLSPEGSFQISFESNVVRQLKVNLGKIQGYFYAEPGKHYRILLPPKRPKSENDLLNPYFQPEKVHLGISDIDADDLNLLINRFDQKFIPFFSEYSIKIYARKPTGSIERFKAFIDSAFNGIRHPFFLEYKDYRLAELEFIKLSGNRKQQLYSRFSSLHVANNNPAFSDLFNRVYKRFLYNLIKLPENREAAIAIYRDKSYSNLKDFLKENGFFKNDRLLELALLKGIYEEFFQSDFPKEVLIELLDGLGKSTSTDLYKQLAGYIRWKVTRLDLGNPAPGFKLLNAERKWVSLEDFKGRYVYLNFASFRNYDCQIQFPELAELAEKYKKELAVVTIIVDETLEDMISRKKLYSYNWYFLYMGAHPDLPGKYNIRIFPAYILIDRDSRLLKAPALSPLEGFKKFFETILSGK